MRKKLYVGLNNDLIKIIFNQFKRQYLNLVISNWSKQLV